MESYYGEDWLMFLEHNYVEWWIYYSYFHNGIMLRWRLIDMFLE